MITTASWRSSQREGPGTKMGQVKGEVTGPTDTLRSGSGRKLTLGGHCAQVGRTRRRIRPAWDDVTAKYLYPRRPSARLSEWCGFEDVRSQWSILPTATFSGDTSPLLRTLAHPYVQKTLGSTHTRNSLSEERSLSPLTCARGPHLSTGTVANSRGAVPLDGMWPIHRAEHPTATGAKP